MRAEPCLLAQFAICIGMGVTSAASSSDSFDFQSYGSVGVARTTVDDAGYQLLPNASDAATDHWQGDMVNRIGGQLRISMSDTTDAIWHGLIQRNTVGETELQTLWAYISTSLNSDWKFKFGRFQSPFTQVSDTLFVGYSYPWVRPPTEFHSVGAWLTSFEGIRSEYKLTVPDGASFNWLGFLAKNHPTKAPQELTATIYGTGVAWQTPEFSAQLRYIFLSSAELQTTSPFEQILDDLYDYNPDIAREYDYHDFDGANAIAAGINYDDGKNLFLMEMSRTDTPRHFFPDLKAAYITVARRFGGGQWTPYLGFNIVDVEEPFSENRLPEPLLSRVNGLLDVFNGDQRSWTAGIRWDPKDGLAIKIQADYVSLPSGSNGMFSPSISKDTDSAWIYSISVDWFIP